MCSWKIKLPISLYSKNKWFLYNLFFNYVLYEFDIESQFLCNVFLKLNFYDIKTMFNVLRIAKINDKKYFSSNEFTNLTRY